MNLQLLIWCSFVLVFTLYKSVQSEDAAVYKLDDSKRQFHKSHVDDFVDNVYNDKPARDNPKILKDKPKAASNKIKFDFVNENEFDHDDNIAVDFKDKLDENIIPNDAREQLRGDDFEPQMDSQVDRKAAESDITDLAEAKRKIAELETKLQSLETRIPKKYPDVKYLNYKSRKRILVNVELSYFIRIDFGRFLNLIFYFFVGDWRSRIRRFSFGRRADDARPRSDRCR